MQTQPPRGDTTAAWPFAPLTEHQQSQRDAAERALRAHRLRPFRAFDDTVIEPALCTDCGAILRSDSRAFAAVEYEDGPVCPACDEAAMADALDMEATR